MGDGRRRWRRVAGGAAAVLVVAAIVYRVLAPTEVVTPAVAAYPAAATMATPGVVGTLATAPLIVDGRLRVYATTRQVRAEQPVDARTRRTPYWSYRRWPAQLTGVVAAGTTVVSRWSDGELVALDAPTGAVRWRTPGPGPGQGYAGRRTGAATVYAPPGLHTGATSDGRPVVVVTGAAGVRGFDLSTGRELWRVLADGSCRSDGFTTTAGFFVTVDTCAAPQAVVFHDLATGAVPARWRPAGAGAVVEVAPVGCAVGRSACPAMRTTGDDVRGWLLDGSAPVAAPALDPSGAWLIGDVVVHAAASGDVLARSARTGAEMWRRKVPDDPRVIAVQPGRVHLLTRAHELITLDPATGAELSRFVLTYGRDATTWATGSVYAGSGFVAVERLTEPVDPAADDRRYYANIQPVILAGT